MSDGDDGEDLDSLDITACKDRILRLRADRERLAESTERLQERLKALNNELAARKEEADRSRQELLNEQAKNRRMAEQRRQLGEEDDRSAAQPGGAGGLAVADRADAERQLEKVRHFIEEQLQERVPKNVQRTTLGTRTFNETELMVEKSSEDQEREAFGIDTVLITYNLPNSELHYNLSYRVDRSTTAKKLREDACLYWNVSEVEFILKTMDNSKVHDDLTVQSCFRRDEAAHLILAQKTPKETRVLESEQHAIRPKIGRNSRPRSGENASDESRGIGLTPSQDFFEPMKALPGLWEFMTQRDRRIVDHVDRIKLRNICLYLVLIILTLTCFNLSRPPTVEYYVRQGLIEPMSVPWVSPETNAQVHGFEAIRTVDEAWYWLTHVLPGQLMVSGSQIRGHNYMPGWVQIRQQRVREGTGSQCHSALAAVDGSYECFDAEYSEDTLDSAPFEDVRLYWRGCNFSNATRDLCEAKSNETNTTVNYIGKYGVHGRSLSRAPWEWKSAAELRSEDNLGYLGFFSGYGTYPPDGYVAEYDLQHFPINETYAAYQQDMQVLRENNWITTRTRMITVEFLTYNGNRDYWAVNTYVMELPPTGHIITQKDVGVFRPFNFATDTDRRVFFMDIVRLAIVLYIITYQIYSEVSYERAKGKSAMNYLLRPLGIADMLIGVVFLVIAVLRHIVLGVAVWDVLEYSADQRSGFQSARHYFSVYYESVTLETFFLCLVVYRWISFFRINRHTFVLWSTIERACKEYAGVSFIFAMLMVCFAAIAHAMKGHNSRMYSTFPSSCLAVLMQMYGVHTKIANDGRVGEQFYSVVFQIIFVYVVSNSWVAVLIQTYQKVRVQAGYQSKTYRWKEYQYAKWSLWSPFLSGYLKYLRPKIERPKNLSDEND
eukprot:TRINITY_DN30802_c0_g1_i1.p1 TRINITY_DN30802_c0_g1~~TRINITY_DN30802_c0_g1_i1.p1  ORF type:complete len:929 (-),score=169.00 TRINITY_DN30802_c0_g1_i1:19-2688(-)